MANSDLKIRTKEYALSVIRLFAALPKRTETQILGRQLLRAGTSVEDSRDGRVRVRVRHGGLRHEKRRGSGRIQTGASVSAQNPLDD
jgi:hypothetical protein